MKAKPIQVQKVGWTDMPAVTRMTFAHLWHIASILALLWNRIQGAG
jgi:hypothetical protein